jgi:copper chaperone CopZ
MRRTNVMAAGLIVLLALPFQAAADAPPAAGQAAVPATAAAPKLKLAANETAIYLADMHCAGCAKKVSSRLFRVKGVMKVRTDLAADVAVVTPQAKKQIDPKTAWAAVQAAGKRPVKLVGPQGTFVADEKTKALVRVAEVAPANTPASR